MPEMNAQRLDEILQQFANVRTQWARLGAGGTGETAVAPPDIEQLIIDTVQCSAQSPQVVLAAVTWLSRFGNLVAEHRLAAMVQRSDVDRSRLGLVLTLALDASRQHDRRRNLSRTLRGCAPGAEPEPFFEQTGTSPAMIERARRRASPLSAQWNLWMDPIEPKNDALRSVSWIIEANPTLRMRADFRGDLRASLLLCLENTHSRATISQLAHETGASRLATTHAMEELELGGHVNCERVGRTRVYQTYTATTIVAA